MADNTIFLPGLPRNGSIDYLIRLINAKADSTHNHVRADIVDFMQHDHDDKYYKLAEHELKMWYSGNGNPNHAVGVDGDFYVDTLNGLLYKKVAVYWEVQMSIVGTNGTDGINGTDGKTAYRAAQLAGYTGTEVQFNNALKEVSNKVDKVAGKSLILDNEITRLAMVVNFNPLTLETAIINETTARASVDSLKVDKVVGKSLITDAVLTRLLDDVGVSLKFNLDNGVIMEADFDNTVEEGFYKVFIYNNTTRHYIFTDVLHVVCYEDYSVIQYYQDKKRTSTYIGGIHVWGEWVGLDDKVDKVTGYSLIDTTEIVRLGTYLTGTASGTNTGDQDLSGKEAITNKVIAISEFPTDENYPSELLFANKISELSAFDGQLNAAIGDIGTAIDILNGAVI